MVVNIRNTMDIFTNPIYRIIEFKMCFDIKDLQGRYGAKNMRGQSSRGWKISIFVYCVQSLVDSFPKLNVVHYFNNFYQFLVGDIP